MAAISAPRISSNCSRPSGTFVSMAIALPPSGSTCAGPGLLTSLLRCLCRDDPKRLDDSVNFGDAAEGAESGDQYGHDLTGGRRHADHARSLQDGEYCVGEDRQGGLLSSERLAAEQLVDRGENWRRQSFCRPGCRLTAD